MVLKPIPLSAYRPSFVPPVTGVNGLLAPVANSYDTSGHFRPRSGSKRFREDEEIDTVFDLSQSYPPLTAPGKSKLDKQKIGQLLVVANELGTKVKNLADDPETDDDIRAICKMNVALLNLIGSIYEDGFRPLADTGRTGTSAGPAVAAKPPVPTGLNELKEGLANAEKECILFDANLGKDPIANRSALAANLSAGIVAAVNGRAAAEGLSAAEEVRLADDALSCVTDMEFLGTKSGLFTNKKDAMDPKNNTFCTMPIKLKFEDRNARINFEQTAKKQMGLRAVMSLPQPIRIEQAAFHTALKNRYKDHIITVRPDTKRLELIGFRKKDGERGWTRCSETLALLPGTLLPGYNPRREVVLPPDKNGAGGGSDSVPGGQS